MTYNIYYIPKVLLVVSYFQNLCENILMTNKIIAPCNKGLTHNQCCEKKALELMNYPVSLDTCYNYTYNNYSNILFECKEEEIETRVNGWSVFGMFVIIFSITGGVIIYMYFRKQGVVYNHF